MKRVLYPSFEETVYLHQKLIEDFGGKTGIRDPGLLQSALARPQTGYYETLSLQAAALLQSLAQNHPFVDGNKRVAIALPIIFLKLNGYKLRLDPDEAEDFLVNEVIQKRCGLEEIQTWLESHLTKIKSSPQSV